MAETNLTKEYREWHNGVPGNSNIGLSDDDINLGLLKVEVNNGVTWVDIQPITPRELSRQVEIKPESSYASSSGAFGQVHASQESQNTITVTIETGVIKGLNRSLKLRLDDRKTKLTEVFGKVLEIDPGKFNSYTKKDQMKLDMAIEQSLGAGGAKAVIKYQAYEYKAKFVCEVRIKGKVMSRNSAGHILEQTIGNMISDLRARKQQNYLPHLRIDGDTVLVNMSGEVEFRWESDHSVHWNNA